MVAELGIVAIFAALFVGAGLVGLVVYLDYRQRRDMLAPAPVVTAPPEVHYHVQTLNLTRTPEPYALPPGDDDMEGVGGMAAPRLYIQSKEQAEERARRVARRLDVRGWPNAHVTVKRPTDSDWDDIGEAIKQREVMLLPRGTRQ